LLHEIGLDERLKRKALHPGAAESPIHASNIEIGER